MKLLTVIFEENLQCCVKRWETAKLYDMDILEIAEKLDLSEDPMPVAEKELKDLKILAPIVYPAQDVLCLGLNFYDHQKKSANWEASIGRSVETRFISPKEQTSS